MGFINNAQSILGENDDTLGAMSLARHSNVKFQEPYALRGSYSIQDTGTACMQRETSREAKSCL